MLSDEEIAKIRRSADRYHEVPACFASDMLDEIARLRSENERLKAARLRSETVREVLTMERIEREVSAWKRNGEPEGIVGKAHYLELCRLALLGLEREQEANAPRLRAQRRDAAESDAINAAFGAFPDLEPEPKRDERAGRIERAALAFIDKNFDGARHARVYAEYLKASQFHTAADFFRVIAAAMEEP